MTLEPIAAALDTIATGILNPQIPPAATAATLTALAGDIRGLGLDPTPTDPEPDEDPEPEPEPEPHPPAAGTVVVDDTFQRCRLITNEYAHWNAANLDAIHDQAWKVTSGSLYTHPDGGATNLHLDQTLDAGTAPNATSGNANNSAIFRGLTRHVDGDTIIELDLDILAYTHTPATPPQDWDGVHIFTRYAAEDRLYYVSINRRDGKVIVKKKTPGGPSNGGTYTDLSTYVTHNLTGRNRYRVETRTRDSLDVEISLYVNDEHVVTGTDYAQHHSILGGRPGIRSDNTVWRLHRYTVTTPT